MDTALETPSKEPVIEAPCPVDETDDFTALVASPILATSQLSGNKDLAPFGLTVDLYGELRAKDLKEVSPYGF